MDLLSPNGLVSIYSIIVGLLMIGMWSTLLLSDKVSDLETNRLGMTYHIIAEYLTGIVLLIAGLMFILNMEWSVEIELVALGMLLYTVINSPGYYAQRRERGMVVLFSILTVLTMIAIIALVFSVW